jgi:hypothetical protein
MNSEASKFKTKRLTHNSIMAKDNHGSLHKTHTKGSIPRVVKMVGRIPEVIPPETTKTSQ